MKISALENVERSWNRYFPIQSLRQLASVSVFYLVTVRLLLWLLNSADESGSWAFLYVGVAAGSVPALIIALPQVFRIEAGSHRSAELILKRIDELLIFRGYRNAGSDSVSDSHYATKLPAILSWKESEFVVRRQGETIIVRGPRWSTGWLRNQLMNG
jgi:hypothetical protein